MTKKEAAKYLKLVVKEMKASEEWNEPWVMEALKCLAKKLLK